MKIYIAIGTSEPKTGKGFFFYRLANYLAKYPDVEIVSDPKDKVDIALHNIQVKGNNATKNIVRVDGVYHNTGQNYKVLNRNIFKGFHRLPDGVVYQSNFAKLMTDKYLGLFKGHTAIIPNGADPNYYSEFLPSSMNNRYNFLTAARWRPHKRLRDTIESFLLADIGYSCLYVAGDLKESGMTKKEREKYFSKSSVIYLGKLKQPKLARHLVASNAFIHLCWIDWCPNGVVEAICAGVPVITNNVGGTHEIVGPSGGIICDMDKLYNFKPCDLYHPPPIDRQIVADAIKTVAYEKLTIINSHVNIEKIAKQYVEFFERILK